MALYKTLSAALALAGASMGAPSASLDRRAVVAHDSLNPIATRVQAGAGGDLINQFNPKLHIASGCQPYTAVDDEGNTSGGLSPTGSSTGACRDTAKGQTYARIGVSNGVTGIMYSWYMPKDQLADGVSTGAHRHDWENVVIWVDNSTASAASVLGGAASGHGDFKKTTGALPGGATPQVEYFAQFPTNHELQFTGTVGVTYAVSDWDAMPDAARAAIQNTDFGSANPPFKDGSFESNLQKAAL